MCAVVCGLSGALAAAGQRFMCKLLRRSAAAVLCICSQEA